MDRTVRAGKQVELGSKGWEGGGRQSRRGSKWGKGKQTKQEKLN